MNLAIGLLIGAGVVIVAGLAAGAFIEAGDIDPDEPETGGVIPPSLPAQKMGRVHPPSESRSRAVHPAGKRGAVTAHSDGSDRDSTHKLLDCIPTNGDRFVGLCSCGVLSMPVSARHAVAAWHLTHRAVEESIDTFAPGGDR